MEFKDKLKTLRKSKYLSQEALAKELYVSRSLIARWEAGLCLPTMESLEKIADYFGVDKDGLIEKNITSEKLVEKNITINKFKRRLIYSLIGIGFLFIIASCFFFIIINNKEEYIDKTPTITKIEFVPIYDQRCVDDLNYGIEESLDISVINHNEIMTNILSKSLKEYDNSLKDNKYFLYSGGVQQVKIYFNNPYNVEFYQVSLDGDNAGYSVEGDKIIIKDNYILIEEFDVDEEGLLNLELKVTTRLNWSDENGAGNIKECYYLFDNENIKVYIGDVYSYSSVSNVKKFNDSVQFEISSEFNPGSYGKLIIYDSNYNKVDEYVFDTEKDREKYIFEMSESNVYYYVMLFISDIGGSIYKPVVLVTDYGMFRKNIFSPIIREFLSSNDLYIKIDESDKYKVKQIVICEDDKITSIIKDFEVINGTTYAIQSNYDKKSFYKYYVVYEFESDKGIYNDVIVGITTLGSNIDDIFADSGELLYADVLDIEILSDVSNLKIGDEIKVKVTLKNLPNKEYIMCGLLGDLADEGVKIVDNSFVIYVELTEVGKLKIGLKFLTFIGENGSVEYVYFNELKCIEVNVNE